jgi:integrase
MPEPPRLLDRVRAAVRTRHYSRRTVFLSHLAVEGRVSASTQAHSTHPLDLSTQRLLQTVGKHSALVFLYRHVLDDPLPWIDDIVRARRSRKLPVVLARDEVRSLLAAMTGTPRLVAAILYGGGLRLLEALRLRIKDVDFAARLLVVREGKGAKDRRTMLPDSLQQPLHAQIEFVCRIHRTDLAAGRGEVWLRGRAGARVRECRTRARLAVSLPRVAAGRRSSERDRGGASSR